MTLNPALRQEGNQPMMYLALTALMLGLGLYGYNVNQR